MGQEPPFLTTARSQDPRITRQYSSNMTSKRNHAAEDIYSPSNSDADYQSKRRRTSRRNLSSVKAHRAQLAKKHEPTYIGIDSTSEDELAYTPRKQACKSVAINQYWNIRKQTLRSRSQAASARSKHPAQKSPHSASNRTRQHSLYASAEEESDDEQPIQPRTSSGRVLRPSKNAKKDSRLAVELASLTDFNKPPRLLSRRHKIHCTTLETPSDSESSSDSNSEDELTIPTPTRRSCRTIRLDKCTSSGKPKSSPIRAKEEKTVTELEKLRPWLGWTSEEDDSSSGSDDEEVYRPPRVHSRKYPPKTHGTQNVPWAQLPGEIRNHIYNFALADEVDKVRTVVHYPGGVPRRSRRGAASDSNFAHSCWGFTQVSQAIRREFKSWLVEKRRVRTPLETVNKYIDVFHPPNCDGGRFGWIEPFGRAAMRTKQSTDLLQILKHKHRNPKLHLELTPPTLESPVEVQSVLDWSMEFDEFRILQDLDETYAEWSDEILQSTNTNTIRIKALTLEKEGDVEGESDESDDEDLMMEDIVLKLTVDEPIASNTKIEHKLNKLSRFIFATNFIRKEGLRLKASVGGGFAGWVVRRPGVVDLVWKQRRARGQKIFLRLTESADTTELFQSEILD